MKTGSYYVGSVADAEVATPARYIDHSQGFTRTSLIDHTHGSVHSEVGLSELEPGGLIQPHVHSFEEGIFIFEGEVLVSIEDKRYRLGPGDYAIFQSAVEHSWRNVGEKKVQWLDMLAPQPRQPDRDSDVFFQTGEALVDGTAPDLRDPRTRYLGHFDDSQLPPPSQIQMDGVRSGNIHGISLKMLVDHLIGAQHLTMFIVEFQPGGRGNVHDHPFEETYYFMSGEADGEIGGDKHTVKAGEYVWAGVGTTHGFFNNSDKPVRWLETQAPKPPPQQAFRFQSNWEYLAQKMASERQTEP